MTTKNVIVIFFIVSVVFTIFVILRKKKTTTNNLPSGNNSTGFDWNFLDNVNYNENTWGGADSEYTEEEWNEINAEFEDMNSGWGG